MTTEQLYTNTPLSKAIFEFFTRVEGGVSKVTTTPGSLRAYLFGGCALHIHTNARGSNDIDVEFSAARHIRDEDILIDQTPIFYKVGSFRKSLVPDSTFSPVLGPLHEDYQEDAIQLQTRYKNSPLWIYVVIASDLAISKLGRFGDQDRQDILTLLQKKCMTVDSFYNRAKEAISYYPGNTDVVSGNLDYIVKLYQQSPG